MKPTATTIPVFPSREDIANAPPPNLKNMISAMVGLTPLSKPCLKIPLHDGFRLPIDYLPHDKINPLSNEIMTDLELIETATNETKPMYEYMCSPTNEFSKNIMNEMAKKTTTSTQFLRESQKVIFNMKEYAEPPHRSIKVDSYKKMWEDVKENEGFLERHSYMEWSMLESLNKSVPFLQSYSMINIVSPIFSLLVPFIFLIFPFILLKLKNIPITFQQYLDTLRQIAKNHFIGKVLNIRSFSIENIAYLIFIGVFYFMQMYQNVMSCIRYHKTIQDMNHNLLELKTYLLKTTENMKTFVRLNMQYKHYEKFCKDVAIHRGRLLGLINKIGEISPFELSIGKFMQLGHMLDCYYYLYSNMEVEQSLRFSVGFQGYMEILHNIYTKYTNGIIGKTKYSKKSLELKKQYYPPHIEHADCVLNSCNLKKNMIITGVNASGKTTIMKTTAINMIMSQQFGFGFYSACKMKPFTQFHSYLNIPDTSGRDSLFQAESRRCKEILDKIAKADKESRHFCIFDELYSGTNPEEASKSAFSFLHYLSKIDNVKFMLTTHYHDVCDKFVKNVYITNYKMEVLNENGKLVYTYQLKKGISNIHGGIEILKNMDYPEEIIKHIQSQSGQNNETFISA